jgi:pimeloyl-ACP methyl ester carboxylesterase
MTNLNPESPTVVLVHGAFADVGSWAAVLERLLAAEVKVQALAIPMRGLASDSAYVASAISQIEGPVLAVGHSYGGAVISNACTQTANVVGLVFVNGFATELDEALSAVEGTSRDSALGPALVTRQYPTGTGDETAAELYVNPANFNDVFCGDLPEAQASVLGASQRPIAAAAFDEKSGAPAWKTLPSWAVVATGDKAAGTDITLAQAKRANADIVEADGSHLIMVSQPQLVTDHILKALRSVSNPDDK